MYGDKLSQRSNSVTFSYEISRSLRIEKKNPEVTTGIEQKGKKSPPRETHARSCTAHARSDSKYNVYFVTKGYSFRVCRCYCEATENFCWNIFWVNTTKTRIMDARPFRGRIVLLGWEDYRNLIKSLKNLQRQKETLGNKRFPFSLTPEQHKLLRRKKSAKRNDIKTNI